MMVDYSPWLEALGSPFIVSLKLVLWGVFAVVFCFGGGVMILQPPSIMRKLSPMVRAVVSGVVGVTLILTGVLAAFQGGKVWDEVESVRESSGTFTERTEKTFGITHLTLTCENDCPAYGLPADGTKAKWLDDDRLVHGEFVIDGSKVGLAGPDGTLLKEAK